MPGTLPLRQYDLVICDIDGCLVSESQKAMDVASLSWIAEYNRLAVERGDRPIVTVCSGRPQPFAEAMCRLIGNMLVPCVCEMGAWVYHPGTNEYELDPGITQEHLSAVQEASAWARRELGPKGVTQQPGKNASVTLYHPDVQYLRSLEQPVREEYAKRGWPLRVSMTWYYINCDLEHVSKGSGLDRMLRKMSVGGGAKIDRSRLAGIGDTIGDKCIADRVGFFACPSNAHPAIKEHAHHIASQPEAVGVVEILKRLIAER